jgi:hypothetical protein
MTKPNCWEVKKCGREVGGAKTSSLGICPASTEKRLDKKNSGKNGGRACWVLEGTLCGDKQQGSFVSKLKKCLDCDFFKRVHLEEKKNYIDVKELLKIIQK